MPTPEQKARETIDAALKLAGWCIQDRAELNLSASVGVAVREFKMAAGHGYADYLLFVDGQAVGALEANAAGHTLARFFAPMIGYEPHSCLGVGSRRAFSCL